MARIFIGLSSLAINMPKAFTLANTGIGTAPYREWLLCRGQK
jgi:hypothetical protein